jgi:hypothetical protein
MSYENVGPNMFFVLRVYQMTEAELAEEIESDRDLIRQGFMNEDEFQKRSSMRRMARDLRRRDDMPWHWNDLWCDIAANRQP